MLRIRLLTLLVLSLAVVAHAADSEPPWQRLLRGDDARKAAALQQRIEELKEADKYAEAISLQEELIALRTKVQGSDHWQTVLEKGVLTALKKVAALPAEKRAKWRQAERRAAEGRSIQPKDPHGKSVSLWQERLQSCREVLGENHPNTAESYNNVAADLQTQGKYVEAEPLLRTTLDIYRKALGDSHPYTATSYNNVAVNLQFQSKYAEAEPLSRKALDIRRTILGEEHADTADGYNSVAANLYFQGKYTAAEPLFRKALNTYRKVLGENHPQTALVSNNFASSLVSQGKYAEAGPLYHKALDINRTVLGENHPDTVLSYLYVAANLQSQGKHAEARPLLQKALDSCRTTLGENHQLTARSYHNLALSLRSQGEYAEAGPLFQRALDIRRKILGENHRDTATSYNNVALNLKSQERYEQAAPLYQKALDIRRTILGEDHPDTANSYNNVGLNLESQGKYGEAGPLLDKALGIRRKILGEEHPDTANGYNNVAGNLLSRGKAEEAEPLCLKALNIFRRILGENHPNTALSYQNVAMNFQSQGKYAEALASLETAAHSYEAARLGISAAGLQRAPFGAERSPYDFLAAAHSRAGRAADAWAALEANLARGLFDEWTLRNGLGLTPAEEQQLDQLRTRRTTLEARILALVRRPRGTEAEKAELKQLLEQRQEVEKSLVQLAVRVSRREVATLNQLQAALPADAAFVAWVDVSDKSGSVQEHWGCVVRPKGEPRWERLPGSAGGEKWTVEDGRLPRQFREALTQSVPAAEIDALARKLHAQRLAPLEKHLTGVKRLFVAPVNRMAGIPIEVLTNRYAVSYCPSGTYLARLKDRPRPHGTRLMAIGDSLFPPADRPKPPTTLPPGGLLITQILPGGNAAQARLQGGDVLVAYAGQQLTSPEQLGRLIAAKAGEKSVVVQVWREGQAKLAERELAPGRLGVTLAKDPALEAITARRQTDQILAKLTRGDDFAELPGTQAEIARLAALFDPQSVTTLTRADASEQRLDQLRKTEEWKQYRYLHFATHGKANNVRAFDSALILTRPTKPTEPRAGQPYLDGRLTAAEVLKYWKLDAELVTLSACESGLGREGGGDGLLGFAQAFLLAGSRSVCLSLWQVDDTATALLMDRLYRNLLGKRADGAKPMGKATALHEAKQWLRNVPASEALALLGEITKGVVRGERPAREEMRPIPRPKDVAGDYKPYVHPRYWAAFILIGDPE